MATKKVVIEVEVPEGMEWLGDVVREFAGRLSAYALLQSRATGGVSEEEVWRAVEEAREKVWERVKYAYTSG